MPTIAEKIERFTQLVRVMESLDEHTRTLHFNMKEWRVETACGTTMCAAGFCASDPWFQERGFLYCKDKRTVRYVPRSPKEDERISWPALFAFFGYEEGDHSWNHPIFQAPQTVDEVIAAARDRIKQLSAQWQCLTEG